MASVELLLTSEGRSDPTEGAALRVSNLFTPAIGICSTVAIYVLPGGCATRLVRAVEDLCSASDALDPCRAPPTAPNCTCLRELRTTRCRPGTPGMRLVSPNPLAGGAVLRGAGPPSAPPKNASERVGWPRVGPGASSGQRGPPGRRAVSCPSRFRRSGLDRPIDRPARRPDSPNLAGAAEVIHGHYRSRPLCVAPARRPRLHVAPFTLFPPPSPDRLRPSCDAGDDPGRAAHEDSPNVCDRCPARALSLAWS